MTARMFGMPALLVTGEHKDSSEFVQSCIDELAKTIAGIVEV
jgi:hypothetical protein